MLHKFVCHFANLSDSYFNSCAAEASTILNSHCINTKSPLFHKCLWSELRAFKSQLCPALLQAKCHLLLRDKTELKTEGGLKGMKTFESLSEDWLEL